MITDLDKYKISELKGRLQERGLEGVDNLAVFNLGANEQIIGEISPLTSLTPHVSVNVKNPKRLLRLQQVVNGGLSISFYVGDMDLVSEGECEIMAPLVYRVSWLNGESQIAILALYLEYTDRRVANRAREAGIITSDTGLIRGT